MKNIIKQAVDDVILRCFTKNEAKGVLGSRQVIQISAVDKLTAFDALIRSGCFTDESTSEKTAPMIEKTQYKPIATEALRERNAFVKLSIVRFIVQSVRLVTSSKMPQFL